MVMMLWHGESSAVTETMSYPVALSFKNKLISYLFQSLFVKWIPQEDEKLQYVTRCNKNTLILRFCAKPNCNTMAFTSKVLRVLLHAQTFPGLHTHSHIYMILWKIELTSMVGYDTLLDNWTRFNVTHKESCIILQHLLYTQTTDYNTIDIVLTLKVLNFWKFTSYCSLKPLWSGMGEVVPACTSPTIHPPSTPTVHQLSWLAL